ncbi:hypothetical protein L5I01_08170 [Gordonia sp. HY442]|uniref:hypothetical protein n=1 Tax=Gordonia zhenghanii TaxID=2911516 RepID=UPI001F4927BE|nr:hypothetical protein [Gordonia zhenghanii]MCF8603335.1 hypothetical protein [Gordonia zhenghanii]
MMLLVRLIDVLVEFVKLLVGAPGHRNVLGRVAAWLVLIAVIGAVVALIAWGVSLIPELIDLLNDTPR